MTTMLQRIRERVKLSNEQNAISAGSFYGDDECVEAKAFMKGRKLENEFLQQHIDALIQAVGEAEKGLEESASHWFNRNDPTDPYHDCACMGCDMGGAGEKVDERGHDVTCPISLAGKARASMQSILEKAMK